MATSGYEFDWMKGVRGFTLDKIKDLSEEQLVLIPDGFNNNVLWHVGHLLYYQCVFLYGFTQQAPPLPEGSFEQYKQLFDNGTSPKGWHTLPDVPALVAQFASISETIAADAHAGKFGGFKPVELFPGMTLHTSNEAAAFHCIHEGMHYGSIGALKLFLG